MTVARRPIAITFLRIEGCGNNFILLNDTDGLISSDQPDLFALGKKIADRAFGLGSDGVMIVQKARDHFPVVMINPDGSLMGMCGNGIRCVTRALFLWGLVSPDTHTIYFSVEGRPIVCETNDTGKTVTVDMGSYSIEPSVIPTTVTSPLEYTIEADSKRFSATSVSMGNPHCVIFQDDVTSIPLEQIGPKIEHHSFFPKRTNVEFCKVETRKKITVRVWERGAGITLACGTGACAVAVAGMLKGLTVSDEPVTISLPGGDLTVTVIKDTKKVFLTGPAQEVASGELLPAFLSL